jgi:hypothetical protein
MGAGVAFEDWTYSGRWDELVLGVGVSPQRFFYLLHFKVVMSLRFDVEIALWVSGHVPRSG